MSKVKIIIFVLFCTLFSVSGFSQNTEKKGIDITKLSYENTWASLTKHPYPAWFQDAKFGIYFHWGVYSVPAFGSEWYPRWMNIDTLVWGANYYKHHLKKYGKQSEFGYKDFIPMFKAEKFNADEWAKLFKASGARFAGPVAEHSDGFSMWDSKVNPWNAKNMGPKRDIVGELEKAIRKQGIKFIATFHHQWEWGWYATWDKNTDCADPKFEGLYGPKVLPGAFDYANPKPAPSLEWYQKWKNKTLEVINKYEPDMVWFDSRLSFIPDSIKRNLMAYYYNKGLAWNREVTMTYKAEEFPKHSAVYDIEKGIMDSIVSYPWLTDASIDNKSWCHNEKPVYKSSQKLIAYLITIVSKNGQLLLNIPPTPDGKIPAPVEKTLLDIGGWLGVNGEAIYGTRPWTQFGEGPTTDSKGDFNDKIPDYTSKDFRFTTKGDTLYAICMTMPTKSQALITTLAKNKYSFQSLELVGYNGKITYTQNESGVLINLPSKMPSKFAYALRIKGLVTR